jgi:hypothetical protein
MHSVYPQAVLVGNPQIGTYCSHAMAPPNYITQNRLGSITEADSEQLQANKRHEFTSSCNFSVLPRQKSALSRHSVHDINKSEHHSLETFTRHEVICAERQTDSESWSCLQAGRFVACAGVLLLTSISVVFHFSAVWYRVFL